MKKFFLFLIAVVTIFALSACALKKNVITAEQFSEKAAAAGYDVEDASDLYSDATECLAANKTSGDIVVYQIYFEVFPTVAQAKLDFNYNESDLSSKGGSSASASALNYDSYKLSSGGYYYAMCRVENTMVYVGAPAEYKNEISDFLKTIGY